MAIQMASGQTIDEKEHQALTEGLGFHTEFQFDENGQPKLDDKGKPICVRTPILPDAQSQVLAANISGARKRLDRLRAGKLASGEKLLELVEIDGEALYIKRLNWSELTRCHLLSGRKSSGELDISGNDDDLKNMLSSAMLVAVFCDELGQTPYFSGIADAIELAEATDVETVGFVAVLFNEITAKNPGLQPTFVSGARLVEELRRQNETSATSTASTTSTPPTGENGSSETASTELPSTSPDISETNDSQNTGAVT